jgi:hypothetical protein
VRKLGWIAGKIIFFSSTVSAQMIYGPTDHPKDYPKALAREEKWVAEHPTYGFTRSPLGTPDELISTAETRVEWPNCVARLWGLVDASKAALDKGQNAKAKEFAERALRIPDEDRRQQSCPVGWTVFYANLVLGRVALLEDHVQEAERFLLLAGQPSGPGPALASFGPNMSLARELLKTGQKSFWKSDRQLDTWILQVRNGQMPVFGANLSY